MELTGAYILYKHTWPKNFIPTNQGMMGNGGWNNDPNLIKHKKMSKVGFGLIFLGFLFQVPIILYNIYENNPSGNTANKCY